MGQRPKVCSGADPCLELGLRTVPGQDFKLCDLDFFGLELHLLALAGQLISWNAAYLLGRERRRHLLYPAHELGSGSPDLVERKIHRPYRPRRLSFSIVGIGGPTKTDAPSITLVGVFIELGQPGK